MASDMLSPPLPRPKPRIPKLSYRNSYTDDVSRQDSFRTTSTSDTQATASTAPTSPGEYPSCAPPQNILNTPTSAREPVPTSPMSSSFRSTDSSAASVASPKASPGETKRKGNPLLGFFTVKEPSAQAFEEYQKAMRKKASSSNQRALAARMPGVSSAKLPPSVPKVNSRWDGVPEALKDKEKRGKDEARRHSFYGSSRGRRTTSSQDSYLRVSSASSRGTTSSHSSGGSRAGSANKLSEMYGWESSGMSNTDSNSSIDVRTNPPLPRSATIKEHAKPDETPTLTISEPSTLGVRHATNSASSGNVSRSTNSICGHLSGLETVGQDRSSAQTPSPAVPLINASTHPSWINRNPVTMPKSTINENPLPPLPRRSRSYPSQLDFAAPEPGSLAAQSCDSTPHGLSGPETIQQSSTVVLRSKGSDVLSPPTSTTRKADSCVSLHGQSESTLLEDKSMPPPILKKPPLSRRLHYPHRPKLSSYFLRNEHKETEDLDNDTHDRKGLP